MVSNAVKMSQDAVIAKLERLCAEHGDNPEYKKLRNELPKDWPI